MSYNYKVRRRDPKFMQSNERAKRFLGIARVPFIMDSRPGYHQLGSQFLIDRALGLWDPVNRGKQDAPDLTDRTLWNYANWLVNFLEYCEARGISTTECSYRDVQERYQGELSKGMWSRDGEPLSPTTINTLVDQACAYLMWLEDKGHRTRPFLVPTTTVTITYGRGDGSRGGRQIMTRAGKVKQNKKTLRMPTNQEVLDWLDAVEARSGYTFRLICELILRTAIRRSEAAGWRAGTTKEDMKNDTLPYEPNPDDPQVWRIPNREMPESDQTVTVTIKYGVKGKRQQTEIDHGDKVGPSGTIQIPLDLARKLQDYRDRMRPAALVKRMKKGRTEAERAKLAKNPPVHLFLDEDTGERITSAQIYTAWTGAKLPFKGWSPHLGRDFWACSVLERELQNDALIKQLGARVPADYIKSIGTTIIQLHITPQLRHASSDTSIIYVDWAVRRLARGLTIQYDEDLARSAYEHQKV